MHRASISIKKMQGSELDLESISSHLVLFSSLSAALNPIHDILEIGTFKGETTHLLARLFPTAKITMVDLPVSDPIFSKTYRGARGTTAAKKTYETVLRQNVSPENVTFIESNTFSCYPPSANSLTLSGSMEGINIQKWHGMRVKPIGSAG